MIWLIGCEEQRCRGKYVTQLLGRVANKTVTAAQQNIMAGLVTHDEQQLDEEANESHKDEPNGCLGCYLVELCGSSVQMVVERLGRLSEAGRLRAPGEHAPFRSGFVQRFTSLVLFLPNSCSGVTNV